MTRWNFVGKVISLLFNMLSRLVITFLPRSKHLLISWLQSRLKYYEFIITSTPKQLTHPASAEGWTLKSGESEPHGFLALFVVSDTPPADGRRRGLGGHGG